MNSKSRSLKFSEAILEATALSLRKDPSVYIMGLGVPDPKGLFGTTLGLEAEFGSHRVLDMPISENGMTGVAIGSAISGMRPILTHQRVEFALLSVEQIVNQAAKWFHMTAGKKNIPLVIRMIIGRGWGQGAQHSQSLESWFAHIPGLKVVMPATPHDAKGLLISAVEDNNPVIYIEHRWLHNTFGEVPEESYTTPIGKAHVLNEGSDLTIVAHSYMTIEAIKAVKILIKEGINCDLIDLRTIRPLDIETIISSVEKTKRLLVVDNGWMHFGVSAEIISIVSERLSTSLETNPKRIGIEDVPIPSTRALAKYVYPTPIRIVREVASILDQEIEIQDIDENIPTDQPDASFTGPF